MTAIPPYPMNWSDAERATFARRKDAMPRYGFERVDTGNNTPDWQIGLWFGEWLDERRPDGREATARQSVLAERLEAAGWVRTTIASPNAALRASKGPLRKTVAQGSDLARLSRDALKRSALRLFQHGGDAQPGDDQ